MRTDTGKEEMNRLRDSYEKIADGFSLTRSKPWAEFKLIAESVNDGDKVLDLGCGNGRLYDSLKDKKINYTGVDFSSSLLSIAKEKYPQVDFVEQNITELDIDDQFDRVVSVAVLNHLPSHELRLRALQGVYDLLKDDGKFILVVWNLWSWNNWKVHLKAWSRCLSSQGRYGVKDLIIPFGKEKVGRYYYAFTLRELKRLLVNAGFEIEIEQKSVKGRDNFFFVCRKRMAKAVQDPVRMRDVLSDKKLSGHPAVAMSGVEVKRREPSFAKRVCE
jgi:SAM-dependent methyltransferase